MSVLRAVDLVGLACARVGYVLLALVAVVLTGDVVLRYVFNAPTIWAQDVAIAAQVWLTYLGMAFVLRQRKMIRITALLSGAGPGTRRLAEGFTLLVVIAFCAIAVFYGWRTVADSILLGRRQPTMLEMPNWISELPVVLGFLLLGVQALADLVRLPFGPAPSFSSDGEGSAH